MGKLHAWTARRGEGAEMVDERAAKATGVNQWLWKPDDLMEDREQVWGAK